MFGPPFFETKEFLPGRPEHQALSSNPFLKIKLKKKESPKEKGMDSASILCAGPFSKTEDFLESMSSYIQNSKSRNSYFCRIGFPDRKKRNARILK
ncbi:hypothetical protein CH380_05895 [Leptospira adleri]|uniref:Uncharacterized protein n=1 Tax=Leptospira adleri TaxID=2023186 RepID=A0A2M9YRC1_9LEPT|nr:hypothetical protein CH380_05895 [Leptospira adleri]PJZ63372.1 hypothetical protein CH376_03815 [Leptospira adleri]